MVRSGCLGAKKKGLGSLEKKTLLKHAQGGPGSPSVRGWRSPSRGGRAADGLGAVAGSPWWPCGLLPGTWGESPSEQPGSSSVNWKCRAAGKVPASFPCQEISRCARASSVETAQTGRDSPGAHGAPCGFAQRDSASRWRSAPARLLRAVRHRSALTHLLPGPSAPSRHPGTNHTLPARQRRLHPRGRAAPVRVAQRTNA